MDAIDTLTAQYTQQYPDLLPRLTQAVSPDRFWCAEGFLVQDYLGALYYHVWRWGFGGDTIFLLDDDAGWRRARDAGFKFKTWITKKDNKVRRWHQFRHLEFRPINERFSIQVKRHIPPMYPRDPVAHISDTINCRCKLAFSME